MANEMQWSSLDALSNNPCHLWQAIEGLPALDDEGAFHLEFNDEVMQ